MFKNNHRIRRLLYSLLILILVLYLVDVLCLCHTEGGLNNHAVRKWYLTKLRGKSPVAKTRQKDQILSHNDVATDPSVIEVEYDDTICSTAKKAVEVRENARYTARQKGSVAMRAILHVRDFIAYNGNVDFSFEQMKRRQKARHDDEKQSLNNSDEDYGSRPSVELSEKELCMEVYESSKRTNKRVDEWAGSAMEEEDLGFIKEGIFGLFHGYPSFIVETTLLYSLITFSFVLFFMIVEKCCCRQSKGARGGDDHVNALLEKTKNKLPQKKPKKAADTRSRKKKKT